jgi:hypothetical protein
MPAILEAALRAARMYFDKAAFRGSHQVRRRGKVAHAGRIDDGGCRVELVPARRGGGMPSLGIARQFRGQGFGCWRECVHQRRFSHA